MQVTTLGRKHELQRTFTHVITYKCHDRLHWLHVAHYNYKWHITVTINISRYSHDDELQIMSTGYILRTEDILQNTLRVGTPIHYIMVTSNLGVTWNNFMPRTHRNTQPTITRLYTTSCTCQKTSTRGFTNMTQSNVTTWHVNTSGLIVIVSKPTGNYDIANTKRSHLRTWNWRQQSSYSSMFSSFRQRWQLEITL